MLNVMFIKRKNNKTKNLYKILIALRENIQNNKKKIFKLKKTKWKTFIHHAKKKLKRYNRYKITDQSINLAHKDPIRPLSYKRRFKNTLISIKKLRLFFGKLLRKETKKLMKLSKRRDRNTPLSTLEKRIDTILFRAKFCLSMRNSRQLISHKKISINNKIVKDKSYIVQTGDLIQIKPNVFDKIEFNLVINKLNHNIWPIPPKYLNINYKTMEIIIGKFSNTNTNYHFYFDLNNVLQNYKYH